MIETTIRFTLDKSDPTVVEEIDTRLKKIGIYKESCFDDYKTFCDTVLSNEKYSLGEKIKSDILSIIQSVADDKNVTIIVQQMVVGVGFGLKQVKYNCTDMIKNSDLAEIVGDYTSIIITPNK